MVFVTLKPLECKEALKQITVIKPQAFTKKLITTTISDDLVENLCLLFLCQGSLHLKILLFLSLAWSKQDSGAAWELPSDMTAATRVAALGTSGANNLRLDSSDIGLWHTSRLCGWGSGGDLFHTRSLPTSYRDTETSGKLPLITHKSKLSPTIWGTVSISLDF